MQIEALPNETNTTDMLHGLPQPKPRNSVSIDSRMCHQVWTKALAPPPTRCQNSRLLDRIMVTRATMSALSSSDLQNHEILRPSFVTHATWRSCHVPLSLSAVHVAKKYVSILLMSARAMQALIHVSITSSG